MALTAKYTKHANGCTAHGAVQHPQRNAFRVVRVIRGSHPGAGGRNGNVTYLANSSQGGVAQYRYDPYGNTISSSGSLAAANTYRFSSKEIHLNSGHYHYGHRWYDPNLQRWLNRDPLGERGGLNLYGFVRNEPVIKYDPFGLDEKKSDSSKKPKPPAKRCKECPHWVDRVKKTNSDTWASDCQDFCLHMCNHHPIGVIRQECFKTCTADCEAGKIPDLLDCITSPPETKPGPSAPKK